MKNSFYSYTELKELGFKSVGQNVCISKKCSIYSGEEIEIGDNVRVDDFVILSGKISLGSFIHISAYTALFAGSAGIIVEDYCTISGRCSLYAVSDDYSGEAMTNPMIPEQYRKVDSRPIYMKKYSIIGAGSIVLPGVIIEEGAAFGAMSLINKNSDPWMLHKGIPAKSYRKRSENILQIVERMRRE